MDNLQFQDFSLGQNEPTLNAGDGEFRPARNVYPSVEVRGPSQEKEGTAKKNFFSFEFYQQYFDVDTEQVYSRILNSMAPKFGSNFITNHIQPLPDLYGPFWICVTLVFMTAICGNLAKYIETSGDATQTYGSDFRLVTGASMLIACYVILTPFALYSLFWYRKSEMCYSYLELFCAYGYSLSIFVPVSILWVINIQMFRWVLIIISVVLSGSVLVSSLWPALKTDRNRLVSFGTIFGVLLLHSLLAIAFKEYYFDVSQSAREVKRTAEEADKVASITPGKALPALADGAVTAAPEAAAQAVDLPITINANDVEKDNSDKSKVALESEKMKRNISVTSNQKVGSSSSKKTASSEKVISANETVVTKSLR